MAVSAIQLISANAKKIRRANPKKDWKTCIKEASAAYNKKKKPAKVGAVKKGSAKKAPAKKAPAKVTRPARDPGKKAPSGLVHTKSVKTFEIPKVISGVGGNGNDILARIKSEIAQRNYAFTQLQKLKAAARVRGRPAAEYQVIKKAQRDYVRSMKAAGDHISNLKRLL